MCICFVKPSSRSRRFHVKPQMGKIQSLSDPRYVSSQYRNASNLNARIRLHQLFSTNKYGWQRWLFDQFRFPPQGRVLELGCGTGLLWLENLDRLPRGVEFLLSDLSQGMLQQAQENLTSHAPAFQYKVMDAQSIPLEDQAFDVVIANHMLYHVPDRGQALCEIRRVLKPGGRFYASTLGKDNMKEMSDLVSRFDPQLAAWGNSLADAFNLENGAAQLRQTFARVDVKHYQDALEVTDAALLADYILSGRIELPPARRSDLADFVRQEIQARGGTFHIRKDGGLFEAR
jgi:ubiquinone/menaquinone biosynthesis C-methylase UbiE